MDIILWRHAEAEESEPDEARVLTAKGRKQAARMAEWLDLNLPQGCKILVSPTARTLQTMEALDRKFKIHPDLAPNAKPERILQAANWPNSKEPVLIIGHQPTLGLLASSLITGMPQDWTVRKGSVWWIAQRERGDISTNYLRVVMAPEFVGK